MIDLSISVPDSFLCEEVRDGFIISKQNKELWAVQLDLVHQLDVICTRYSLRYFAGAGTLLGAVRHHGFIPWDDDMDFYMLRDDYDKLVQLSEEFKAPYFLQNAYTDPNLMRTSCRLRNIKTTFYTEWDMDYDVCKGIFIDIFPLDGICDNYFLNKIQKAKGLYYQLFFKDIHNNFTGLSTKKKLKRFLTNFLIKVNPVHGNSKLDYYRKYENNLKKYSLSETAMWGNRTMVFDCPKSRRPIVDWRDIIRAPFEFTTIPIPRNYDEILKQQYGDYMIIPDEKHRGSMHHTLVISTDYAYDDLRRLEV